MVHLRLFLLLLATAVAAICFEEQAQLQVVTAAEAVGAENILSTAPDDPAIRTGLIRYYFFSQLTPLANESMERRRRVHILWLAENYPQSPVLGRMEGSIERGESTNDWSALETIWRKQIAKPKAQAAVLANAGYLLRLADRELAAALLQQALKLDPGSRVYAETLGLLYAEAALGVTKEILESPHEVSVEESKSKFAEQARASLEKSRSKALLRRASRYLNLYRGVGPAAKFGFDPVALSQKLMQLAHKVNPVSENELARMWNYYGSPAIVERNRDVKLELIRTWIEALQQGIAVFDGAFRSRALGDLARAEYLAGNWDAAFDYSGQLLVWVRQNAKRSYILR